MLKKRKKRITDFQFRAVCNHIVEKEHEKENAPLRNFFDRINNIIDRFNTNADRVEHMLDLDAPIPPETKEYLKNLSKDGK